MTNDLSWMLDGALEVPGTRHAVLISADGLLMARSSTVGRDDADTVAAAMGGMQSLSRTIAEFCDGRGTQWRQTLIEFEGGWVFLIAAGSGAYLAVAATHEVDMEAVSFRMQQLVGQLGSRLMTPPRQDSSVRA